MPFQLYIRGICIKTSTWVHTTLQSQLQTSERELRSLELPAITDLAARRHLVQKLNQNDDICTQLAQHSYKEYVETKRAEGNRAGSLLANLV